MPRPITDAQGCIAAVDLGSNSFHLAIARLEHGALRKIDSLSEKVQLAAGLDEQGRLSEAAQQRALACLARFAQRIHGFPAGSVRVVATNALRQASNSADFLPRAEALLGHPIGIIAGREEARLIYLGVAHSLASPGRRLVIDIGGGSTELIIGEQFDTLATESLEMGCVTWTSRFFAGGELNPQQFARAQQAAEQEVLAIERAYRRLGWQSVVGSSGTIKAATGILTQMGLSEDITQQGLLQLRDRVLQHAHVDSITLPGLKNDRRGILPAGLAILLALFQRLHIDHVQYANGALREGVLHDAAGQLREKHDVRDRTVSALCARYQIDSAQATRVEHTALAMLEQVQNAVLGDIDDTRDILRRAARLHEIGLAISHSGYHRHGSYLLRWSDLPGFTRQGQWLLSLLVGAHRRRLSNEHVSDLQAAIPDMRLLCLLLRLSVVLHRAHADKPLPALQLQISESRRVNLIVGDDWLQQHPLSLADLQQEMEHLKALDWRLRIQ